MDIKSVLKLNGEITKFYCEEFDIYLKLTNVLGVKSLHVSETLDDIDDIDCPSLESVLTLETIVNMSVEPVETLTLSDVLTTDNDGKTYRSSKLKSKFICKVTKIGASYIPRLYLINPFTDIVTNGEITDTFELVDMVNAKFVEVN